MFDHIPDGISPGEFLSKYVIKPMRLSVISLAKQLNIPANRLYLILNNRREITADTALRLGKYFNTGPELWLFVQMKYNLKCAQEKWTVDQKQVATLETANQTDPVLTRR